MYVIESPKIRISTMKMYLIPTDFRKSVMKMLIKNNFKKLYSNSYFPDKDITQGTVNIKISINI